MAVDALEAFKNRLSGSSGGPAPAGAGAGPAGAGPDDGDGDGAGMSPGDQAIAAIKSGDGAAFEEAIHRIVGPQ